MVKYMLIENPLKGRREKVLNLTEPLTLLWLFKHDQWSSSDPHCSIQTCMLNNCLEIS